MRKEYPMAQDQNYTVSYTINVDAKKGTTQVQEWDSQFRMRSNDCESDKQLPKLLARPETKPEPTGKMQLR